MADRTRRRGAGFGGGTGAEAPAQPADVGDFIARRGRGSRPANLQDRHHILFNRQEWRLRPESLAIREHPSLVPAVHRDIHEELHGACPAVPALGYNTLIKIARN